MTTLVNRESVLLAVPVGKENAVGATKIKETLGLRSMDTIKRHLSKLVGSGEIHVTTVRTIKRHKALVYYRAST